MIEFRIPLLAERISRMLESLEQDREFETPPAVHPLTFTSASAAFPPPERATPSSDNIQVLAICRLSQASKHVWVYYLSIDLRAILLS